MEHITLVFIVLPLLVGGAVLAGAFLMTRIMPGEGKAVPGAAAATVSERGPQYAERATDRKKAYRTGYMMLLVLAILTVAEVTVGLVVQSVALLLIVNIVEAAAIVLVFMHLRTVWSSKEAH